MKAYEIILNQEESRDEADGTDMKSGGNQGILVYLLYKQS